MLFLSDHSKHCWFGSFKCITKCKILSLERGKEEGFVLVLQWDGTVGSREAEN